MSSSNFEILVAKLDTFIRKYYKNQLIRGSIYVSSALLISFLVVVTLEYVGNFDKQIRAVLFFTFLSIAAFSFIFLIVVPLFRLYKLGKGLSHEQAAQLIGKHFPEIDDKLLNTLQLKKMLDDSNEDLSLLEAGIRQKIGEMQPVQFSGAIDFKKNIPYLRYLIPPALVVVALFLVSPNLISTSTKRIIEYSSDFEIQAPFNFIIDTTKLQIVENDDLKLEIKLKGSEVPNEAFIQIENASFRLKKENNTSFNYLLKKVKKSQSFRIIAGGFESKVYEVKVVPKAMIQSFKVTLNYPLYTGKEEETIHNIGDLNVPEGTKAIWNFSTKNTEKVRIYEQGVETLIDRVAPQRFTWLKELKESFNYQLSSENNYRKETKAIEYSVRVIKDEFPTIFMEERIDSTNLKLFFFRGILGDDYGFSSLRFRVYKNDQSKELLLDEKLAVNLAVSEDQFFHAFDFSKFDLKQGDQLMYFFTVFDNDAVNGVKGTNSTKSFFKVPSLEELDDKAEESSKSIKEQINKSIQKAKSIQKNLNSLSENLLNKTQMNWQDQQQMENLLQQHNELKKDLEQLNKENEELIKEQEQFNEIDPELLEKQKELEKLMNEVMDEELEKLLEEIKELMENLEKEEAQEKIEEWKQSNEEMQKELENSLELFKQFEFEQKAENLKKQLEELAKEQEKLSEKTENSGKAEKEELKKEQEKIEESFEELKEDMKELQEKNEKLDKKQEVPEMEEKSEEAEQEMKEAKEDLENNKEKKASEHQKKAADQMQEMSDDLSAMLEEMQQEQESENLDDMRQLLENIVQLSFDQENLLEKTAEVVAQDPMFVEIGRRQIKLKDDLEMIADSLNALAKRVPAIGKVVYKELDYINEHVGHAIDEIQERKKIKVRNHQQHVMTGANNLALLFKEMVDQMMKAMQQSKPGDGSCNKPGGKKPKPGDKPGKKPGSKPGNLPSISKMQKSLQKQLEALKKQLEGGKKPGSKPGNGKLNEQLARQASEQRALRKQLEKLAQEQSKDGSQMGNALRKITEEMEKLEKDIVNKNISTETLNRQREILTRLLESEKAERERDLDEKRESREVKKYDISNPEKYFKYNDEKLREIELLKTISPEFNKYYKERVNKYFNKLGR